MIASPKRRKDGGGRSVYPIYFIVPAGQMTHAAAPVDNTVRIGEVRLRITGILSRRQIGDFGNAFPPCFESSGTLYGARSHPRARGPDLRAPARRLGRQRHKDRIAAWRGRSDGRPARRV